MATITECDQCGRQLPEKEALDWLAVVAGGDTADFCSWACLRDRAVEAVAMLDGT